MLVQFGGGGGVNVNFDPNKPYLNGIVSLVDLLPNATKSRNDTLGIRRLYYGYDQYDPHFYNAFLWQQLPPSVSNHSVLMVCARQYPDEADIGTDACTVDAYWAKSATKSTWSLDFTSVMNEDPWTVHSRSTGKKSITLSPAWASRGFDVSLYQIENPLGAYYAQSRAIALALSCNPTLPSLSNSSADLRITDGYSTSQYWTDLNEEQYSSLLKRIDDDDLRKKYDRIYLDRSNTDWTDTKTLAQFEIQHYLSGYGYDSSTTAVRLSLAVLLTYICVTVAHLIYTLITGNVATSWDSIAELVTLALNSQRPDSLENTSVGVDTLETFRQLVNIRVNDENSAEIVFRGRGKRGSTTKYNEVVRNEKY